IADAVARAIAAFDASLVLFAPPGSALARAGASAHLLVVREGFADRRYGADGALASRSAAGAVIEDADLAAEQAVSIVRHGTVVALDGTAVALRVDTICVHGDHPGAAARAARVRAALEAAAVSVTAPRR
ncbi:MAG: LamB/YcsF family protein, partial [Vicinamibacterales bacterium]